MMNFKSASLAFSWSISLPSDRNFLNMSFPGLSFASGLAVDSFILFTPCCSRLGSGDSLQSRFDSLEVLPGPNFCRISSIMSSCFFARHIVHLLKMKCGNNQLHASECDLYHVSTSRSGGIPCFQCTSQASSFPLLGMAFYDDTAS